MMQLICFSTAHPDGSGVVEVNIFAYKQLEGIDSQVLFRRVVFRFNKLNDFAISNFGLHKLYKACCL